MRISIAIVAIRIIFRYTDLQS